MASTMYCQHTIDSLQRYLHIGNDVPVFFDTTQPVDMELGKRVLTPAVHLPPSPCPSPTPATVNGASSSAPATKNVRKSKPKQQKSKKGAPATAPAKVPATPVPPVFAVIKRTIKNKSLRRLDECLFALAYCGRELPTDEERHLVFEALPELLSGPRELFAFLSFYTRLATEAGYAGFGHGLRCAITRWYDKHSALELAEMIALSNGAFGWTHADVIRKTHLKLECPVKRSIIDAATKRASQQPTLPLKKLDGEATMDAALVRYLELIAIRSVASEGEVFELIKRHGSITYNLLPLIYRRLYTVWMALYPHLSYRELLDAILPMQDFDVPMIIDAREAYVANLTKRRKALEQDQIHPIVVHGIKTLYDVGKRYPLMIKEREQHSNLLERKPQAAVSEALQISLEHSFSHHPKTGAWYYITLDLRSAHQKKHVLRNSVVTCFEASVLLAFSIFKREKHVAVEMFTDDVKTLQPVNFRTEMSWSEALNHCKQLLVAKTKVALSAPISKAQAKKQKVDVFITITDSLIRVNPNRIPPWRAMLDYRKTMHSNLSRYICVSLCHHKPSLKFDEIAMKVGGILEVIGYSQSTVKVIEAFAKNLFF
ncbi:RNA-binding protein RO60-like [Anopheles darlingi]|uniref:RNA-binding protein RO60-like n=1 Tax=Anopheles darlingi TaxID=43151 RepID=UPI0020FFFFB0|nr:RNA-binding protein RO60-like [Anopheles darlingi]XP_049529925.1 RNA-binding protein RO60-like [Anopheles darlingi]XP_049529926.1 RNA-binding protein RO60-like [Anopheles darlingi]XP_049529927.1 RNA-binding protein RO60-like [Anopheles darlingi]XP_049529928.1 RNA-binding protein RO60-like [Anopheles darlingi]